MVATMNPLTGPPSPLPAPLGQPQAPGPGFPVPQIPPVVNQPKPLPTVSNPDIELDEPATPPPLTKLPNLHPMMEMELTSKVRQLFILARDRRRHLLTNWDRNYRVVHKPVNPAARAKFLPNPFVSEIFSTLDTLVGWMTDQQPRFDVAPAVQPNMDQFGMLDTLAQHLKTVMQSSWQVDLTDAEVEKVVWDGFIYGIGFFKTTWDSSAYRGYGNGRTQRVDPYSLYVDPDATSMEGANYFIEARTMSVQEMERRFPGATARTRDGDWTEDVDKAKSKMEPFTTGQAMATPGAMPGASVSSYGLPGQGNQMPDVVDTPAITVLEAWLRTPISKNGKVYDGWRCVVVAGNRVLLDKMAHELWSHGSHPYDRYVPVETGEFYGDALVDHLVPLQSSINNLLASMEHNIWLTGNPMLKESNRAGTSRKQITNRPGQRFSYNEGGDVSWMIPPELRTTLAMDLVRFYVQEIERVSGLTAMVRGSSPTGRNAQGVIDSVQEAAFVRIRRSLRSLSRAIGSGGEKMASMIVEFYDEPRLITLAGSDGEQVSQQLRANHFYVPSEQGMMPMRFQLLVDAGEAASQSRGQRIAEADALYAMGAFDVEAVLEVHAVPGWKKIAKRVNDAKAAEGTQGMPPTQRAAARR